MVEKARRGAVEQRRPDADPAWEVLARDDADGPLRYVGTLRAEDAEAAHEEATRLFCWFAHEVWVCPTSELWKFSSESDDSATPDSGSEERVYEL